jgi:hypothetical protein
MTAAVYPLILNKDTFWKRRINLPFSGTGITPRVAVTNSAGTIERFRARIQWINRSNGRFFVLIPNETIQAYTYVSTDVWKFTTIDDTTLVESTPYVVGPVQFEDEAINITTGGGGVINLAENGLKIPRVSVLPSAADNRNKVVEQGNQIWFSNGSTWIAVTNTVGPVDPYLAVMNY